MKFKVGDKVRIKQANYSWRQIYVDKIGIIKSLGLSWDYVVRCKDGIKLLPDSCWDERDLDVVIEPGQQLEFSFMEEI